MSLLTYRSCFETKPIPMYASARSSILLFVTYIERKYNSYVPMPQPCEMQHARDYLTARREGHLGRLRLRPLRRLTKLNESLRIEKVCVILQCSVRFV